MALKTNETFIWNGKKQKQIKRKWWKVNNKIHQVNEHKKIEQNSNECHTQQIFGNEYVETIFGLFSTIASAQYSCFCLLRLSKLII